MARPYGRYVALFGTVFVAWVLGLAALYSWVEDLGYGDGVYKSISASVGLGLNHVSPQTDGGKAITSVMVLGGIFLYLSLVNVTLLWLVGGRL